MRSFSIGHILKVAALALAVSLLAACSLFGGGKKGVVTQAGNIPAAFDVTIIADKDNQFDLDGAPLTSEDLKSAFRYRQEQSLPMSTVLLKRGEKEKVKNEHRLAITRIAHDMNFKVYEEEKGGVISELVASTRVTGDDEKPAKEEKK